MRSQAKISAVLFATILPALASDPFPARAADPAVPPASVVSPVAAGGEERFIPDPGARCGTGTLELLGHEGIEIREFPLKHTEVNAQIAGSAATVRVTQTFQNPYEETIEAVYVFPLPHEAAVTNLEMRIGERVIRGLIERREAAKRIYENAKRAGKIAALLEEERANIFTQSVANILPGHEIEIAITYLEELEYESGSYEFVFPMVVGPRYVPGGGAGIVPAGAAPVPDASRINPPFLPPPVRSGHDIDVQVDLDAGVAIEDLASPTHVFEWTAARSSLARVRLHRLDRIPNKDFVLRWKVRGDEPETAVLTHHSGGEGYVSVVLHPKTDLRRTEITGKEMVFVLDCSGSMQGEPLAAAKTVVRHALRNVGPDDSFQIIRFSTSASGFAREPLRATPENVHRGIGYVDQLRGGGGTHMIEGIKAALSYPQDGKRLRIVMFLTDGYIGNENQILASVRDLVGSARLFSFGVGKSANRFLLDEMAREGRGEVQYVLPGEGGHEAAQKFYDRIRSPYLTDIELEWVGVHTADVYPARLPDLFQGKPLTVRARYREGGRGELVIRGRIAGARWQRRIPVDLPARESGNPAVGSLWARARIADLERTMRHGADSATVEEITQLGLRHRLVTPYTSFVAVEERTVVSDGPPKTVRVPVEMPEGVRWEGVFGESTPGGLATRAGVTRLGDDYHVRGGRSTEVKTVVEGMPLFAELSVIEVRAPRIDELKKEVSGSIRVIDTKEQGSIRAIRTNPAVRNDLLQIRVDTDSGVLKPDGKLKLTIRFTNRGSDPVAIPAIGALTAKNLRLRALDARGRKMMIGSEKLIPQTVLLLPGESATRSVTLLLSELGAPLAPGPVHLILSGERWRTKDADQVTIRLEIR